MEEGREEDGLNDQPMVEGQMQHHQPVPPPPQKCPRCKSSNTKFCYFNNYSLSQPRYFCKACRRYWTLGGTQRNVPVGGGCRKNKRSKASCSSSSIGEGTQTLPIPPAATPQNFGVPPMSTISSISGIHLGGGNLSSVRASHHQGINQATVNMGGATQFGGSAGLNLPFLKARQAQPREIQPQNYFSPFQRSLVQPSPLGSWTRPFLNRTNTSAATITSDFGNSFTVGATTHGNKAVPSVSSNQWPHYPLNYNPYQ